jgi:hypothetical protein
MSILGRELNYLYGKIAFLEDENVKLRKAIDELLNYLPDSVDRYKFAWQECLSDEQDAVKVIREKITNLVSKRDAHGQE